MAVLLLAAAYVAYETGETVVELNVAVVAAPGPIIERTTGGAVVIPAALDYVAWTERIGRFTQRDDLKAPERTAWLSGQMSPRARKELGGRGWTVLESFTIAAER